MKKIIFYLLATGAMVSTACNKPAQPTLKVISYNVRLSVADDGDNNWERRKPATLTMIAQEAPDLLGIQEGIIDQVDYIEENCPQYARLGVGRDDGIEGGEVMALYYLRNRLELLDGGTFWLSQTPDSVSFGWDAACRRTATWGLFRDKQTDRTVCYINTHLDHMGPTAREESVKMLLEKLRQIAPEGAAMILGGDFNATPDDAILRPLDTMLTSAREASPITDHKGTYTGFGETHPAELIDYIYFKHLTPQSFRTLDGDYGAPYISDHYPIEAVFGL